jgi:hypothetical protein
MEQFDDFDHPTPEAQLHAFLDGELDNLAEQPLFDELAANPALRSEMRDLLTIRNAVLRDVMSPPPSAEAAIMAAAGLASSSAAGTGSAVIAHGAATAATTSAGAWSNIIRFSLGGSVVGALVAYLLLTSRDIGVNSSALQPPTVAQRAIAGQPVPDTVRIVVPPVDESTLRIDRQRLIDERRALAASWAKLREAVEAFELRRILPLADDDIPLSTSKVTEAQTTSALLMMTTPVTQTTFAPPIPMHSAHANGPLPIQVRFRTLASGLRADEPMPPSVRNSALPNTALSVTVPVTEEHRLGVEFGREAFRQQFRTTLNGRPVEYLQTPTLFWLGATYQYLPSQVFGLEGLRPFVEATLGYAFEQGPIARAAAGLQYRPLGPIAFSLGFDASSLSFVQDNRWLSSMKSGFTTGITIDLGAWP